MKASTFVRGVRFASLLAIVLTGAGAPGSLASAAVPPQPVADPDQAAQLALFRQKIGHVIVIYQENWGFDSLYGNFPGANGYQNGFVVQTDLNGNPITSAGPVLRGGKPDARFPAGLPAEPFPLTQFVSLSDVTGDPVHNFYIQQAEVDYGKMDHYLAFPAAGTQGALTMGYFDATNLPEGKLAQQYVLADNFHQSSFGGSLINNMWAACACTPHVDGAPPSVYEQVDAQNNPVQIGSSEGRLTPDGYLVNTSYTTQYPQLTADVTNKFVPPLDNPTLGDRLSAAGVSWKFYAGGLDDALAGHPDRTFQAHHQSYLYFRNYGPGKPGASHIIDGAHFTADLASGTLPQVSWVKPLGANNEHPGYANLMQGQMYVANLVSQIQMSPVWKDSLVIVLYDEAGGHFDHVAPLPIDRWGPSTRVPAIFISPFARRGYVDHLNYETLSILKTIELRFKTAAVTDRDAIARPILAPFDFSQPVPQAFERHSLGALPPMPPERTIAAQGGRPVTELDLDE